MANPSSNSSSLEEAQEKPPNDKEYLSEWPPVDEVCDLGRYTKRKRPKIDREERVGKDSGCRIGGEESVLWARPALARWWRRRQKERDAADAARLPKSDNPNTLLRFVAR